METLTRLGDQVTSTEEAADQALLDRYRASDDGDQATFEAIYHRHQMNLRTFAQRHLRGKFAAEIEDIIQESFTQFHERRATLSRDTHLRAFLRRIVESKCNDRLRKAVAQKRDHRLTCNMLEGIADPRMHLAIHEQEMYLDEMLSTLPLKEGTALRLRIEGHTAVEAAEIMGETETAVKWWWKDGIERLRQLGMKHDGGGESSQRTV